MELSSRMGKENQGMARGSKKFYIIIIIIIMSLVGMSAHS